MHFKLLGWPVVASVSVRSRKNLSVKLRDLQLYVHAHSVNIKWTLLMARRHWVAPPVANRCV